MYTVYQYKMGIEPQSTYCSPPKQIKHISSLHKHVLLPLTCKISKNHIFSPLLSGLTLGIKSYKVSQWKHKDD